MAKQTGKFIGEREIRRMGLVIAAAAICVAGLVSVARADALLDQGMQIAESSCGACHQVYGDRTSAKSNDSGPSFQAISRMPSTTEMSLKVFLASSHRNMPDLVLKREEIDALADYILSLSGK